MSRMILEVCAADIASVIAAEAGGAGRVELCSGLAEGGFTPSAALMESALKHNIAVNVLIRPRGGDFLYSPEEKECMLRDAEYACGLNVDGVVCGALTADGDIDTDFCRRLIDVCGEKPLTFHRAFDLCRAPFDVLETLISLGFRRILTSGQAASALEGADMLRRLQEQAAGRIVILAGGGVNPENAAEIIRRTGVHELHASARSAATSGMRFRLGGVSMGTPGTDEYCRMTTSESIVRDIVNTMNTNQ